MVRERIYRDRLQRLFCESCILVATGTSDQQLMKTSSTNHLFALAFIAFGTLFFAATAEANTTRFYQLSSQGSATPVTIHWKNISGLDSIDGFIDFAAGEMMFTGRNSSSGFIWLRTETGLYYEFRKQKTNVSFKWVGNDASGNYAELVPTQHGKTRVGGISTAPSNPAVAPSSFGGTTRSYTISGFYGFGQATIFWKNISGNDTIRGSITTPNEHYVFTGSNPRNRFITFTDNQGATYKLNREGDGQWAGFINFADGQVGKISLTR